MASKFQHRKLKPRRKKKTLSFILFIFLIFSLTYNFWHTCEVFIFPSASNFQHWKLEVEEEILFIFGFQLLAPKVECRGEKKLLSFLLFFLFFLLGLQLSVPKVRCQLEFFARSSRHVWDQIFLLLASTFFTKSRRPNTKKIASILCMDLGMVQSNYLLLVFYFRCRK